MFKLVAPRLRTVKAVVALVLVALFIGALPASADQHAKSRLDALPQFLAGGDISELKGEVDNGQVYNTIDGTPEPPLKIFRDAGWNFARVRLWVNPRRGFGATCDLPYTIALGKEIKDSGMVLSLDLHYSDTWADPQHQIKPAAWADLPFPQLIKQVHDYTADVISQMNAGGALPAVVCIGNEITKGMLWPDGQVNVKDHPDYKNLSMLLIAAAQGVKDGSAGAVEPLIMIHIDRGGDWAGAKQFFDGINAYHVPYDMIGLSYYPMYHGPMSGLALTLQGCAKRYKKPIMVIETGYAYAGAVPGPNAQYPTATYDYPFTPDGQNQFMKDELDTIAKTPEGLGRGVEWWAPAQIPLRTGTGRRFGWGPVLFDASTGNALPALYTLGSATSAAKKQ